MNELFDAIGGRAADDRPPRGVVGLCGELDMVNAISQPTVLDVHAVHDRRLVHGFAVRNSVEVTFLDCFGRCAVLPSEALPARRTIAVRARHSSDRVRSVRDITQYACLLAGSSS